MKPGILVVEDDQASRELLQVWLEGQGCTVRCVADVAGAHAAIGAAKPDLILLDIGLGAEDGLQIAAWVRQHADTAIIPVIAVTAHAMVSDRQRIFASGCNAFLAKPVDFEELRTTLGEWLPGDGRPAGTHAGSGNVETERMIRADQSIRGGRRPANL